MIAAASYLAVLAGAALFFRRPSWGLYASLALLPFDRMGTYALNPATGHPVIRPALLAAAALVIAMTARVALRADKIALPKSFRWLAVFAVWAAVPVILAAYPALVKDYVSAVLVMAYAAAAALAYRYSIEEGLSNAILLPALIVGLFGLFQFLGDAYSLPAELTGIREGYSRRVFGFPRVHATASEPLYYANYLLLPFFTSLVLFLAGKRRLLSGAALAVVSLNLVMTTSRGAYLGALLGLVATIWLLRKKIRPLAIRQTLAAAGLAGLAGAGLLMLASVRSYDNPFTGPELIIRQSTSELAGTGSFSERARSINLAVASWSDNPVQGVGVGGYGYYLAGYPADPPRDRVAVNNEYIELMIETGIVGLLLFAAFVSLLLREAVAAARAGRVQPEIGVSLAAAVVAILFQLLTFSGFYVLTTWCALGLLAGWVATQTESRPARKAPGGRSGSSAT